MMSIDRKYQQKYKAMIDVLRELRFSDKEIEDKLIEYDELKGWEPITFLELKQMTEEDWKTLKSYCWKYGSPRCQCIGIINVKFNENNSKVTYSDDNGDPTVYISELTDKIHKIGNDGKWASGLYRRTK
jgi:hypothetical protein